MSRAHHELGEDRDIVFVHSARTPDDIIFARELDLIASNQANFRTAFVCERVGARNKLARRDGFPHVALAQADRAGFHGAGKSLPAVRRRI